MVASMQSLLFIMVLVSVNSFISLPGIRCNRPNALSLSLERLTVQPIKEISGEVTLPGSKSLSNRILLLSAISEGTTTIDNLLDSADTRYMVGALNQMGIKCDVNFEAKRAIVKGVGGSINTDSPLTLDLGNAGTAMRPLAGVLCAGQGHFILDGTPRMRERPIVDLVDGLKQLGVDISCSDTGCPPVVINAKGINGGSASISGQISSQYLSALLMMSPLSKNKITINIKDELMSAPYVHMTMNLMKKFKTTVTSTDDDLQFVVKGNEKYISPNEIFVEGDASSASYFLAGAAITGGTVTVTGCGSESIQGDARFAGVLEKMGAKVIYNKNSITVTGTGKLKGIDEDCGDIPDVAMTLAVVGLFAEGSTKIRNVYNWRVKETERMVAMVTELTKLGVQVEEGRDYLVVHGLKADQKLNENVDIETYDDHRVAMCFSLAACAGVSVNILDPGCTSKTFPDYFDVLTRMTKA
jgi:3-phosphoshikimate 1-carboxyvinyltransferase